MEQLMGCSLSVYATLGIALWCVLSGRAGRVWHVLLGTDKQVNKDERHKRDENARAAVRMMKNKYKDEADNSLVPRFQYPTVVALTGSEGMVGRRTVQRLAAGGGKRIVCLDRIPEPEDFAERAAAAKRDYDCVLQFVRCDITDKPAMTDPNGAVQKQLQGVECFIHIAALVGPFFPHKAYMTVNYHGTLNVLDAARAAGIQAVVDCTSPSTRFSGADIQGQSEQEVWELIGREYKGLHEYAATKAKGEEAVLTTTDLSTCAVAPHQVYGPSDALFLPAMLATAKAGALRIMGSGQNMVSFTHEENIAHALLLAAGAMVVHADWVKKGRLPSNKAGVASDRVAGEYFVVTDGQHGCAINFWDAIDDAVVQSGLPSIRTGVRGLTRLPYYFLLPIALLGSAITAMTGKFVKLTPFTLRMLVIDRYFDTHKARSLLRYQPVVDFTDPKRGWVAAVDAAWKRVNTPAN